MRATWTTISGVWREDCRSLLANLRRHIETHTDKQSRSHAFMHHGPLELPGLLTSGHCMMWQELLCSLTKAIILPIVALSRVPYIQSDGLLMGIIKRSCQTVLQA